MRRAIAGSLALLAATSLPGCVVATSSQGGGGGFFLFFLPLLFLFFLARAMRGRRSRRVSPGAYGQRQEQQQWSTAGAPDAAMLRAELSVLADDVLRLEPQVALNDAARTDYDAATYRYRVAQAALENAPEQIDLARVQRVVDEGAWMMQRARARLDGREPPAPPSSLERSGPHGEPAVRVDDADQPLYVGSPASFRSGWFTVGGGMFGGLMLGSMLGGFGGWIEESSDGDGTSGDWDG